LDVLGEKIAAAGVTNMHPMRLDLSVDSPPAEHYDLTYSLLTLHHIEDAKGILKKFHALLGPSGILCIADLDKEDGSFHTDGTTDVHKGFERAGLQKWVEDAGFADVKFSTAYEIKKKIGDAEKIFPVFLLIAKKA
jgi:2-polyprenyl-3-methyl-5-hydroxy-6-metoxy-1,4-benzoquinol methylase